MAVPDTATTLRDGRYQLLATLGEGAQGETLEALDKREGRLVAIKRFRIKGARSWKDVELAEREARVLARLEHPALPRYLNHFEENGALHLVMDKVEGVSLARHLQQGRRFGQREVVRFLLAAAEVLAYLHGQAPPVIHRDLKPGNVVVRPDDSFAFVDFGSVRDSLRPEGGSTVVGTFGYMAPEQFQGRALPASDVYSVGATALAMLTGTEPEKLPHRGLGIDVRRSLRGAVGEPLVRALERMLVPDPDERAPALHPLLQSLTMSDDFSSRRSTKETGARGAHDRGREEDTDAPSRGESQKRRRVRRRSRAEDRTSRRSPATEFDQFGRELNDELRRAWDEVKSQLFESHAGRPPSSHSASRHRARRSFRPYRVRDAPIGPISVAFAALGISIARVVIWLLFRVTAPVVLALLALFLGSPLRRAARSADGLGKRIDVKLRQAGDRVAHDLSRSESHDRVRVTERATRVRVTPPEEGHQTDDDWREEYHAPAPSVRRRRP